jgi:hypothetical protein
MTQMNLIPEEYIKNRGQWRAMTIRAVLLGLVLLGVYGASMIAREKVVIAEQELKETNRQFDRAEAKIKRLQSLEAQKRNMIAKAKKTASLMDRVPRSYLLGMLNNARPEHLYLTKLTFETQKRKRRSRKGGSGGMAVDIALIGKALTDPDISLYMRRLEAHPLVERVELLYSLADRAAEPETGRRLRNFELNLRTVPGADVLETLRDRPGRHACRPDREGQEG